MLSWKDVVCTALLTLAPFANDDVNHDRYVSTHLQLGRQRSGLEGIAVDRALGCFVTHIVCRVRGIPQVCADWLDPDAWRVARDAWRAWKCHGPWWLSQDCVRAAVIADDTMSDRARHLTDVFAG